MHLNILTKNIMPDCLFDNDNKQAILLIRDSVYLLLQALPTQLNDCKFFALESDLLARGIPSQLLPTNVQLVDYPKFVNLIIEYKSNATF